MATNTNMATQKPLSFVAAFGCPVVDRTPFVVVVDVIVVIDPVVSDEVVVDVASIVVADPIVVAGPGYGFGLFPDVAGAGPAVVTLPLVAEVPAGIGEGPADVELAGAGGDGGSTGCKEGEPKVTVRGEMAAPVGVGTFGVGATIARVGVACGVGATTP